MPTPGRPPGSAPKSGGRKKGTPNKITFDLIQTLREKGFDPAAALVECHVEAMKLYKRRQAATNGAFGGSALDTATRAAGDLMEFVYPKRKAIELTGKDGDDLFQSFTAMVKGIADRKKIS